MKKKEYNNFKKTVLFVIIFLILLIIFFILQIALIRAETEQKNNEIEISVSRGDNTIERIADKYNAEIIDKTSYIIYINFEEDLYDDNGNSNKEYFENIANDFTKLEDFSKQNFILIDEEKNIKINVLYNPDIDSYSYKYNDIENFYDEIDGKMYSATKNIEPLDVKSLTLSSELLLNLKNGNMFFRSIKDSIGEGKLLDNGYTSFKDGSILLKLLNGKVRNMVFTDKYEETVIFGVRVGDSLEKVLDVQKNISSGSIKEGYLQYITPDLYIFIYENEISTYGYSYFENKDFEDFLEEYLVDKDLDKFIQNVSKKWNNYDMYQYTPEEQSAHITFPSRGVEIKIEDNNSKGIVLYKNYYFTDKTKEMIKDGKITLNDSEDLLVVTEKQRRSNFN